MTEKAPRPGGPESGPGGASDSKEKAKSSQGQAPTMGHAFMRNNSPGESLYLFVKGAGEPDEAPEVYYRFTARTLERHGGVPLGSSYYRADVEKDANGLWRADLVGKTFGTFEVYSRYKVRGKTFYSQFNTLHFVTEEIKDAPDAERVEGLPEGWPEYVFPSSRYNKMPFRGAEAETTVDFFVRSGGRPVTALSSYLLDAKSGPYMPVSMSLRDPASGGYSLSPPSDPSLNARGGRGPGPGGMRPGVKNMVALMELPNGETMTFTLTVSRSRWTYRKVGLGLVLVLIASVAIGLVTARRRRKFKYNELD